MDQLKQDKRQHQDDILFNVINRFIGFQTRETLKKTINDPACEYPFTAMDSRQVFTQLEFVRNYLNQQSVDKNRQTTFLDIGCGIGNILLFAEQFNFDVYGLEKDTYPAFIASQLLAADKIFVEDIWSYKNYGQYDVIYYFRPFAAREPQKKFEKMIEDQLKPSAILIANHKNSDKINQDQRFIQLSATLPVWQKTKRLPKIKNSLKHGTL